MKKAIIGIFAHPDDEAIAVCGTLLTEVKAGNDVHLILLTDGGAGTNLDNLPNLGEVRLEEWRAAGKLIGAKTMKHLGYKDGELSNSDMIEIGNALIKYIEELTKDQPDVEIELMSLGFDGFTGHIDHIVAARATCYAFYKLKDIDPRFKRVRLAYRHKEDVPTSNTDWIYMDAGLDNSEIDETIDARALNDEIIAVIRAHHTQRNDGEGFITAMGDKLGLNYFVVKS